MLCYYSNNKPRSVSPLYRRLEDGPGRVGYSPPPTHTEYRRKCRDGVSGGRRGYLDIPVREYSILDAATPGGDACRKVITPAGDRVYVGTRERKI